MSFLIRAARVLVTVFLPWVALAKARRQLYIACACMRHESHLMPPHAAVRNRRWADECAHDGWILWKPYVE